MPIYKKADPEVLDMANDLIREFEDHQPIAEAKVKIDFLFAFPDFDETTGEPINDALKKNGRPALGITRKLPPKDRAKGLGDAEICIDGHWWSNHDAEEQRALLDHELRHIAVTSKRDDLGRPILKMRQHDVEFGWFNIVAQRHGAFSVERQQAKSMMDNFGQLYWPGMFGGEQTRVRALEVSVAK